MRYPRAGWNATAAPFPEHATVVDLLREAVRRSPDADAVGDAAGTVFTYRELDAWSDRLARLLTARGVGPGEHVALYSERDSWAVVSLVAVLKTGAAYVPLDPDWPPARTERLLDRLGVAYLVAGAGRQRAAQRLAASVPSVRGVVCPGRPDRYSAGDACGETALAALFDHVVEAPDRLLAAGFNTRGTTAYTVAGLEAYRRRIARLFAAGDGTGAAERPSVLEIGCGSGELVGELAGDAGRYVALDVSPSSVKGVLERHGGRYPELEGVVGPAHRAGELVTGPFDVVVMSSVVQFFPDVEYLYEVLEAAVGLLRPGGRILLGDLVDPERDDHPGLALPRGAFRRIGEVLPSVARVTVHERGGAGLEGALADRFDAELVLGPGPALPRRRTFWSGPDVRERPATPPEAEVSPGSVAYVIFTSGSTGVPKGVVVRHRPVVNLITWLRRAYGVGPRDRVLSVASFCFDLSVFDVFGTLAAGGYVRVAGEEELSEPDVLLDILVREDITVWNSAPAMLGMATPYLPLRRDLGGAALRLVLLSGDWIPLTMPGEIRAAFPAADVVALGGATECTVWSNHFLANDVDPARPSVPYGVPMDNARYYVLDERLAVCPVGVAGDLYIGGVCVADGYAGDPSLTATRFLPDPWAPTPGAPMYRTGDRARWGEDGVLEFLGRTDDQVKVRGHRIELGEVRGVLTRCEGVRAAVVLAVPGPGGSRLAAFYLADGLVRDELLAFARRWLPRHMVPDHVVEVPSFPVNRVGKVDRAALTALVTTERGRP
ncbi:amino acid adenylation domain-containing protein [Streptomyces sp. JNUCC 64]